MGGLLNVLENRPKKVIRICGYSIWKLIAYVIIYSIVGFFIETAFGIVTKGVIESRSNFLYGPFCLIYGVGAVIMILFLKYFDKNNNTLFWGGFIIGSLTEYIISYLGEIFFHVVWWDYSEMPVNINGRICVYYSIFWGLLAIYLVSYINPKIDKVIVFLKSRFKLKTIKITVIVFVIFLVLNFIITCIALDWFYLRIIHEKDLKVENRDKMEKRYEEIYNNEILVKIINRFVDDDKMIKTFPNMQVIDMNGKVYYFTELLPEIEPYYYKFNFNFKSKLESLFKPQEAEQV